MNRRQFAFVLAGAPVLRFTLMPQENLKEVEFAVRGMT